MKVVVENNAPKPSLISPDRMPSKPEIKRWCRAVLNYLNQSGDVYIGLVNLQSIHDLNLTYRHKDKPTNVLSFPFELPPGLDLLDPSLLNQELNLNLGDVLMCPEIIIQEAREQNKLFQDHLAHMVIHGTLHLLGYDHEKNQEAELMEDLEIKILNNLKIPNPYS